VPPQASTGSPPDPVVQGAGQPATGPGGAADIERVRRDRVAAPDLPVGCRPSRDPFGRHLATCANCSPEVIQRPRLRNLLAIRDLILSQIMDRYQTVTVGPTSNFAAATTPHAALGQEYPDASHVFLNDHRPATCRRSSWPWSI
jgi:hypothetical protein